MSRLLAGLAPLLLATAMLQAQRRPLPVPWQPPPVAPCFPPDARVGEFETRWFCGQLAAAGKGRLEGTTAYRLLYLPSFRPAKIVEVRQEPSGDWTIQTTILTGAGGYQPGTIRERHQRWLTKDDVLDLDATVKRDAVWSADIRVDAKGFDGSTLIVEVLKGEALHVHVVMGDPNEHLALYDFAKVLQAMGGIADLER